MWLNPQFGDIAANFRVVKPALPVIAQLQAAGKLQAAVEEVAIPGRNLYFDRYDILVRFRPSTRSSAQPPALPPWNRPRLQAACWWANLGRTNF